MLRRNSATVGKQRLVADIVAELKKGGPLKDPFAGAYPSTAPADYIHTEVQRSLDRVRMLLTYKPPTEIESEIKTPEGKFVRRKVKLPNPTLSDYRRLGRLLRKMNIAMQIGGTTLDAEQAAAFCNNIVQEPPPRADALKHYCAGEAFFLMEVFSAKDSKGEAFRTIAGKLYEAVTGKKDADMERACDWVLKARNKVRKHDAKSKRNKRSESSGDA